jgi:hypothetical protein
LVVVLEAKDQIQLAMAKGLLEDAGIPLFIQGEFANMYPSAVWIVTGCVCAWDG